MSRAQLVLLPLILCLMPPGLRGEDKKEYRVYEYVLHGAEGTIEQISHDLAGSATTNGWIVVATIDAGVPEGCPFQSRVIVLYQPSYVKTLLEVNHKTGPFAVVDRINIFTDEQGTHLSVVNPHSIVRTVMMNDTLYERVADDHLKALRALIGSTVRGVPSDAQYGEKRDEGYIGKTMGIMAGGRFDEKLEDELVAPNALESEIAHRVERALSDTGKRWGTHAVYSISLKEYDTDIIGVTGTPLESRSFDIVGSGSDDSRSDDKCPGLAHAGAYPIELVVTQENNAVVVRMVDAMFRMKMYFEDAGKWAFMKNMSMPGSIKDEILDRITPVLK